MSLEKLPTAQETQDHLGLGEDDWKDLSKAEKLDLQLTTYGHGVLGKDATKPEKESGFSWSKFWNEV